MVNILTYIMAYLVFFVNWGKVCYGVSAFLAVLAIGSLTEVNDFWLIQVFAFAAFSACFAAIGMCESERFRKRMKRQARREQQRKMEREKRLCEFYDAMQALY